jgi:hypothetical protein
MAPDAENHEDDAIELAEAITPTLRRRLGFLGGGLIILTVGIGGELFIPWSDIDGVSTSRMHSGVRVELKESAECLRGLGLGRRVQRAFSWVRGFRGIEIDPSFMQLDYQRLGHALDELAIHHQVRQIREAGGIADTDRVLRPTSSEPETT